MSLTMSKLQVSFQFYFVRMKPIMKKAAIMFLQSVVPYKELGHSRQYFATCALVVEQKDPGTLRFFYAYFLFLGYMVLLYLAFYFLPLSPLARAVLLDTIFILNIHPQFCFFIIGLLCFSGYLYWAMYFRSITKLGVLAEHAFFGCSGVSMPLPPATFLSSTVNQVLFRRIAMIVTNFIQLFIAFLDLCLAAFTIVLIVFLTTNSLFQSIFSFIALAPVFVLHFCFFFIFWCSFAQMVIIKSFCFLFVTQLITFIV